MLGKKHKTNAVPDKSEDKIQKTILSSVPDDGIFFDNLTNKVSEKLKIKKSMIDNYIMRLITQGRIYWKGIKLHKIPPTTHPPSFFIKKCLNKPILIVDKYP